MSGRRSATGDRLRVAFYLDSPEVGGAELFLRGLLGSLDRRIEPRLLAVDEAVAREVGSSRPGLDTVLVPLVRGRGDVRHLSAHSRALRQLGADVVHVNQRHVWVGQYGWLAARLARLPAVGVVHGVFPHASESQRILSITLAHGVDRFVGVSRFAADAIEAMLKVPRRRVVTIPNGVAGVADGAVVPVAERDPRLVAVVGRLAPEKGVDVLLAALSAVPGCDLVVVGDGPERTRLEEQAVALGLAGRVRFVGWRSDPWALRPAPSVVVVPSRRDAAPLVVLEAMQRALPVVASNVGGIGELVGTDTGVLVQPDDARALAAALRSLLDQPARLVAMGRRAAERAKAEFGLEAMAQRYTDLYHEVAGRPLAGGRVAPPEGAPAMGGWARRVPAPPGSA